MSTAKSQSFYYCKYVLDKSVSDDFFSKEVDLFLRTIGSDRPVYRKEAYMANSFPGASIDFSFVFAVSFNRLCRKRGYADYFSAEDLERYRNSEGQFSFSYDEVKNELYRLLAKNPGEILSKYGVKK